MNWLVKTVEKNKMIIADIEFDGHFTNDMLGKFKDSDADIEKFTHKERVEIGFENFFDDNIVAINFGFATLKIDKEDFYKALNRFQNIQKAILQNMVNRIALSSISDDERVLKIYYKPKDEKRILTELRNIGIKQ